ncbi:CoA transferase subunit A [Baekduia soli]|uniref:CoA transferase subunit A n=1 Tax=Baekduia soli TaxID=496014 RepID=A0A5B8U4W9_9ACTN|nr:CoA-transferase [Baekduia soli]QEC48113.1 CoA transferase subunit A [Baekduia soli]
MSPGRTSVVADLDDALAVVTDGAVIGIGGAVTAGHPMALVRGLARRGVRDLTVVAPVGGIEVDILIAAGCVSRVVGCYVGAETVAAVGPVFRTAAQNGTIEVVDLDEAHTVQGLRAAGQGLPFLPWRGGVGTSYAQLNPTLVEFDDPVRGEPLLAIPALELDVALLYSEVSDAYGNAQPVGTAHMDPLIGSAARHVVLQVDRVVSNDEIRRNPGSTIYWRDTTVVRAPFGTHPYSNGWMTADEEHLRDFVRAGRAGGDDLDGYLRRHVHGPADNDAYLEEVGIRRLTSLLI